MIAALALGGVFTAVGEVRAYDYPWCTIEGGSRLCCFASREECNATSARGFGSLCMQNPSYRGGATAVAQGDARPARHRSAKRHSDH
jgi:hypothetical protein